MPNHITNVLDVTGPENDVSAFRDKVYKITIAEENSWDHKKGDPIAVFDFAATIPMPSELEGTSCPPQNAAEKKLQKKLCEKYGAGNWYDWHIRNWGTKWGAYDSSVVETIENGLRFRFNTAWCYPSEWLTTTAGQFPTLTITDYWIDEGGGAGKVSHSETGCDEESWEDETWRMEFDHAYKEEHAFITEGEYEQVIEKYQNETEGLCYTSLEKLLLDRIQDKDLPLFISFQWFKEANKEEFETRLKSPVLILKDKTGSTELESSVTRKNLKQFVTPTKESGI